MSLDGGGTRGIYQAAYLRTFSERVAADRQVSAIDVGKSFDLIVGASTGALVGLAIAAGKSLVDIEQLYRLQGTNIFPHQWARAMTRSAAYLLYAFGAGNKSGDIALRGALSNVFQNETLGAMYERRRIAVAIPTVELERHAAWVFKTRHVTRLNGRDDTTTLSDIALTTTAAPIVRSVARIPNATSPGVTQAFIDGGLWANNPAMLGFIEAFEMLNDRNEMSRPIHLFMLGTAGQRSGSPDDHSKDHRGALGWMLGMEIIQASLAAQERGISYLAEKTAQLRQAGDIVGRLHSEPVPAKLVRRFERLDDARREQLDALVRQAATDANHAWARAQNGDRVMGAFLEALRSAPPATEQ